MPRNGSGTASVVNTFVPFTTADANDVNENFTDIADELTNSLPRDGQAGMTGQLKADDGTVSLPGITFGNDLDTGVRRVGANKLAVVTAGADKMSFDAWGPIATMLKGMLWGLTLSNNVTDATNDIDIAVGYAASDSAIPELMTLGTAITKRLDAGWAVGTNQGGLDTGSVANGTYHVWLIQRSDTGVVDVLFSTSATAPTMPANYDRKRRIGSILRESAAIVGFLQIGNYFYRTGAGVTDRASAAAAADILVTLSVPVGTKVQPIFDSICTATTANFSNRIGPGDGTLATLSIQSLVAIGTAIASTTYVAGAVYTNTAAQIRFTCTITSGTIATNNIVTRGWFDERGQLA